MKWVLAKPRSFSNLPAFLDINGSNKNIQNLIENYKKKIFLFKFIEHFYMTKRRKAFLQEKPIYNYFQPILFDAHRTLQQSVYQLFSPKFKFYIKLFNKNLSLTFLRLPVFQGFLSFFLDLSFFDFFDLLQTQVALSCPFHETLKVRT